MTSFISGLVLISVLSCMLLNTLNSIKEIRDGTRRFTSRTTALNTIQ